MEPKISIAQFLFTKDWKVLSDSLSTTPALSAQSFASTPDLVKFCSTEECVLIMVNVASKEDLIQLATFSKAAKRTLKNNIMKVVVVNATENKQFEKAIGKLGSVEIIEPSLNTKALRFKMDFWMKAMKGQAKKNLGAFQHKTFENQGNEQQQAESKGPVMVPALECVNDIWLLSKESDCKKIIGRWIVKLMGPGPYVGTWNEVPNKKNIWTFQIKKSFVENFLQGEGSWLFKGEQKPEFNWQENRWMITGDDYELFFYDGSVHSRLKLSNKVLSLAGNSMYAKTKEPHIIETFDKEFVFKNDAERITDPSLEFENEGDLGGHLEGKVKEKEEKKGRLEGKSKDQQDEKSQSKNKLKEKQEEGKGHLEGQIKDKEEAKKGHLEGKVKDKEEAKGRLEGDVKEQEEAKKGHLEGKVQEKEDAKKGHTHGKLKEKEEEIEGHLEGKTKDKEEASSGHTKGKLKEKEEAIEGHLESKKKDKEASGEALDGIVKELEEGKGPLKGKTKEEAVSLKKLGEEKKHAQNNDKLKKDWKGKLGHEESEEADSEDGHKQHNEKISKRWGGQVNDYEASEKSNKENEDKLKPKKDLTDHLEKNWGGKGGSDAVNTRGKSGPGVADVKEGSLLDLKKTEKEHQKYYRNHNEATQYEADGTRKNQHLGEDNDGTMGGKTGTDHLAAHYGRGQVSEYKSGSGKGSLDGSNETDKMSTHLGRKNVDRASGEEELEEAKKGSPLAGKSKTDKFKGHYGSGKLPLNGNASENESETDFDLDSGDEFSSVFEELESVLENTVSQSASVDFDLDSSEESAAVLPFVSKQEAEKELEQLTENATVITHIVQGTHRFSCKLDDYFDNTVILLCQDEGLKNSEAAVLDISMSYRGKEAQIQSQGVVMSLDEDGNGGFFVTIEVPQKDAPKYDFFMDMLKARQESIDGFLKKVKGL